MLIEKENRTDLIQGIVAMILGILYLFGKLPNVGSPTTLPPIGQTKVDNRKITQKDGIIWVPPPVEPELNKSPDQKIEREKEVKPSEPLTKVPFRKNIPGEEIRKSITRKSPKLMPAEPPAEIEKYYPKK